MKMIGVRVGVDDGVDPAHPSIEQLLAEIRRRVDQHHAVAAFNQYRRATAAVARVGAIAAPPIRSDRRHAGRYPATKHGYFHAGCEAVLLNRLKKLAVVIAARSSTAIPFSAATARAVAAT